MSALALWCAAVVTGVFVVSAAAKYRDPAAFRTAVTSFGVPPSAAGSVARAVPVLEAGVALLVVLPPARTAGLAAAGLLLAVFAGATFRVLRRGVPTPCACFGRSSVPVGPWHVARTLALVAVCAVGLLAGAAAQPLGPAAALLAALAAVPAVAAVVVLDDLVALLSPTRS